MANENLQAALQIADNAAQQVTGSYQTWTAFLATAGRLYKYPFPEQLMIYAQRPDATACAEYDFWNQRMRRYIRRGSRGIALIDNSRGRPVLRYVFDVSDTGRMDNGLNPNLWQYREEHRDAVTAALEERFDVSGESGFTGQLEKIAAQLANEYWNDHREDILHIIDGSFLEGYDELNTGAAFRSAATVSITYMLMSRCGLEPDNYFQHEDFLSIFDFNTQDTVTELGTAVSIGSEQVLRQIERTVKQYERTKSAERSMEHEERADLHTGGGLPVSQRGVAGTAGPGPGEVREDAPAVLEGAPSGPVQPAGLEGDPVHSSAGDRGHSQQPSGEHDAPAGEGGGGHGTVEGQQPDGVGGPDEQLQGPGGGNYFVGAGLQLSFMPPEIPSQREQMEAILEAESADAPSAFSIPQADVDRVLRGHGGKLRIFELYQQNLPARSIVAAIRKEYGATGGGVVLSDGSYIFLDYRPKTGIEFWRTSTDPKFIVKWTDVEKRIRQMVNEGSYLSKAEMENYLSDCLVQPPKEELPAPAPSQEAPAPAGPAPIHVPGASPPIPAPAPAREIAQEDIDAALQAWNGDTASKRRVQQYMTAHAREKDTAAWLRTEYGGELPMFPVQLPGTEQYQHLPWPKVQRRIAQLVKEDRFFTETELANFDDIDTSAVREQLEQEPTPTPTVRKIYEQYKPILKEFVLTDGPYQNACQNSDRENAVIEGHAAVTRAAQDIRDPDFMRLYFDMSGFRNRLHREIIDETYPVLSQTQREQAEVPDLSGQPVTHEGDAVPEFVGAANLPPRDPLAPPYKVGDTVYLNNTAFEITDIGLSDVQLRDPALPIPLFRAESKENFERLLRLDPRNNHLLPYLPADLGSVNDDIREVLVSHLLTDRDKDYISGWIHSGENNRGLAMRLSEALASRDGTVTLETGDSADYFASTTSLGVDILDKFDTRLSMSWDEIAPVLRALWLQELDGFTHEPVQRKPVNLEGKLS